MADPIKNFLQVQVDTTGYNDADTAITLETGEGALLIDPAVDGEYNVTWWNYTDFKNPADDPNVEIVRITGLSGDVVTVQRPAVGNDYNGEGADNTASTKNEAGKIYKMMVGPTKKTMEEKADKANVLELDNTAEFIPDGDYEPATKKYVDDNSGDFLANQIFN